MQRIAGFMILLALLCPAALANTKFGFADHLFQQGDYYRAVVEYRRQAFLSAETDLKAYAHLRIAESYYLGRQYQKSLEASSQAAGFKMYLPRFTWLQAFSYAQLNQYTNSLEPLKPEEKDKTPESTYQQYLFQLHQGLQLRQPLNKVATLPKIRRFEPANPLSGRGDITRLEQVLKAWPYARQKKPWVAALLSTILPGAGQAYNKNYGDAFSSFFIVSLFSGLAVAGFLEQEYLVGSASAAVSAIFYGGGIYGAYRGSHKYNSNLYSDYHRQLKSLWLSYEPLRF